jgi:hypothetical protein
LAAYRASGAQRSANTVAALITDTGVELDTYLDGIFNEMKLESPAYPKVKETVKGGIAELSIDVKVANITVSQLGELLEKIETRDRRVMVKELAIKRNFRDKEKLDLQKLHVVTFKKVKPGTIPKSGDEG